MTTMLRNDEWKLIVWHGGPATDSPRDGELYHLSDDPRELHNLYHHPDYVSVRRRLKGKLLDVWAETEDRSAVQVRAW